MFIDTMLSSQEIRDINKRMNRVWISAGQSLDTVFGDPSDDKFNNQMDLISKRDFSPHGWPPITIVGRTPERAKRIRNAFLAQADKTVHLYTPVLSDDLTDGFTTAIDKNVTLHILCNAQPDQTTPLYQMIENHVNMTGKGHLTTVANDSLKMISSLFRNNQPYCFGFAAAVDTLHDMNTDGSGALATFGYARNKEKTIYKPLLDHFREAALLGTHIAGQKPKKPFWAFHWK